MEPLASLCIEETEEPSWEGRRAKIPALVSRLLGPRLQHRVP